MAKIRVLVADDHAVLRAGLRLLINTQRDLEVVGETGDFMSTRDAVMELEPDVATIDLSMPGGHGIRLVEWLSRETPQTRLLVLSMHDDPAYVRMALAAGAAGYVMKKSADTELLEAIRTVAVGRTYSPRLADDAPASGHRATSASVSGSQARGESTHPAVGASAVTATGSSAGMKSPPIPEFRSPAAPTHARPEPLADSPPSPGASGASPGASSTGGAVSSQRESARNSFAELSDRERQVLLLVARGHTNQAIANQLFLSVKTIESYRARLMNKLGLRNRAELTQFAMFVEPQAVRDELPDGGGN
jgi:DNA-binding NarL/FixJ family response regulator